MFFLLLEGVPEVKKSKRCTPSSRKKTYFVFERVILGLPGKIIVGQGFLVYR